MKFWTSSTSTRYRWTAILLAVLSSFAGVSLLIDRPEGTVIEWLALPLLAVGGSVFAWFVWPRGASSSQSVVSIATRLLETLTLKGRLLRLFPVAGVALVLVDLGYNLTLSATPSLQTEDIIVLSAAGCFMGYGFVPAKFARERDFVLLFFLCLNGILVLPILAARAYYADFERSIDLYSWVALAPEASAILSLLGVSNSVHAVLGSTAPGLTFVPQHLAAQVTVVITTACSGIYSFGIFASAFIAFVLTEFDKLSRRVWVLLGLGLLTAYLANVLRMVIIVLVGYYTDTAQTDLQNMLIAHSYAGWFIFLAWVSIFWGPLLRLLPGTALPASSAPVEAVRWRTGPPCASCHMPLTPTIPATRCVCGAYLHLACGGGRTECPACGKHLDRGLSRMIGES